MKKKLRVLVLMHEDLVPPNSLEGRSEQEIAQWKTEYDVVQGIEELGHTVRCCGVHSDLGVIRDDIDEFRPHITFNLLEEFHGVAVYDHAVVSFLELMRKRYTGCNPRGLMLAHDKALSKKLLAFHHVRVPRFAVFPTAQKVRRPPRLGFPLLVKSLIEEGSVGISQASIVTNDQKLRDRVEFIHTQVGTDAIAEQYVDGRELYVAVLGNQRLQTFPVWEMLFTKLPQGVPRIATAKVKWDAKYQERIGLEARAAENLPGGAPERIARLCKRVYRTLGLSGYARIDLRLREDGRVFVLEANPNPELAYDEEFAESAAYAGMKFTTLLHRIISLGLRYRAHWHA